MTELPPIPDGESAEEILLGLENSGAWTRGQDYEGPRFTHRLDENGEWIQRDENGVDINKTKEKQEKGDADLQEHLKIIGDLTSKGFSVIRKESSEINSGSEVANRQYENHVHAAIYILKNGKIEFHDFQGKKEDLDKFLRDYEDSIDDDNYLQTQAPVIKTIQTTFNLTSIFGSDEKAPDEAKAESGAWENFWKDLLNPRPKEQEVQGQPKGLFEIFEFKANLEDQNIPEKNTKPVSELSPLNLFIQDSPIIAAKKESPSVTAIEESVITILSREPEAMVEEPTEVIKLADKIESIKLTQPEAAPLYIDIGRAHLAKDLAKQKNAESFNQQQSPIIFEPGTIPLDMDSNIAEAEAKQTKQMPKRVTIPARDSGISLISLTNPIPPYQTSEYRLLKQATEEPTAPALNLEQDQLIKLIVVDNLTIKAVLEPSYTVAPITESQPHTIIASSSIPDKAIFSYQRHSEGVHPTEESQTMDDALAALGAQSLPRAKRGDDAKTMEITFSTQAMAETIDLSQNAALIENDASIADYSPAAIPEFSPLSLSTGENIRDPEPSLAKGQHRAEVKIMAPTKDIQAESKTTYNQTSALREQVRALIKIIKASTKAVELRQPPREVKVKIDSRVRTQSPALERTAVLEKNNSAVILTALENLKGQGIISQTTAENSRLPRQVISISDYRAKQPSISIAKKVIVPKAIPSAERLSRQRIGQTSAQTTNYSYDESINNNSSGILLAA